MASYLPACSYLFNSILVFNQPIGLRSSFIYRFIKGKSSCYHYHILIVIIFRFALNIVHCYFPHCHNLYTMIAKNKQNLSLSAIIIFGETICQAI